MSAKDFAPIPNTLHILGSFSDLPAPGGVCRLSEPAGSSVCLLAIRLYYSTLAACRIWSETGSAALSKDPLDTPSGCQGCPILDSVVAASKAAQAEFSSSANTPDSPPSPGSWPVVSRWD